MNPMELKRGVDLAVNAIVEHLKSNSKKVTSTKRSRRSARFLPMAILKSEDSLPTP